VARVAVALALGALLTADLAGQGIAVELDGIVTGLSVPLVVAQPPDGSNRLFVAEKSGLVRVVEDGALLTTPFLDVSSLLATDGNEQGLLGLAFDPDFTANRFVYFSYTEPEANPPATCPAPGPPAVPCDANSVVVRYQVSSADPNVADPNSAHVLLKVNQPRRNHNGGHLAFGPDGYLYVGLGDGGGGGDPDENAQDLSTLLGAILRIDVAGSPPPAPNGLCGLATAYGVPADNPFVGAAGACDEIWSYGLRNPWRFSFDRATGDLWIGDVGQNDVEEVDLEGAGSAGGENYGWNCFEGSLAFPTGATCSGPVVFPVIEYPHSDPVNPDNPDTGRSVTGGYRYRGATHPQWRGVYFFADFVRGKIWGTVPRCDNAWDFRLLLDTAFSISTFGEDASGELLVADYSAGRVLRLDAAAGSGGPLATVLPGAIEFDGVQLGTASTREIVLANDSAGPEALLVSSISLSAPGELAIDPTAGSDPCGTATPCLAPGESCSLLVEYAPTAPALLTEELVVGGNTPPVSLPITGSAAACAEQRVLAPATVIGTRREQACLDLVAGSYEIAGGGNVTFEVGRLIALGSGFSVGSGGRLAAVLEATLAP
jgi:glucose/arabinose dehydrogenase